jgi:hypothetical protein
MNQVRIPVISPFDLKREEIEAFTGALTDDQLLIVRAVLNGIKAKIHIPVNNGMKHDDLCWSYGPAHYYCAYEKIRSMTEHNEPMKQEQIIDLAAGFDMSLTDVTRLVKAVERRHDIGVT